MTKNLKFVDGYEPSQREIDWLSEFNRQLDHCGVCLTPADLAEFSFYGHLELFVPAPMQENI